MLDTIKTERATKKTLAAMGKAEAYKDVMIKEQEKIKDVALKRIDKVNKDLKVIQHRMRAYVTKTPKPRDELYFELKDKYENLLHDRHIYQQTVITVDESVTAAQMNHIIGQGDGRL